MQEAQTLSKFKLYFQQNIEMKQILKLSTFVVRNLQNIFVAQGLPAVKLGKLDLAAKKQYLQILS